MIQRVYKEYYALVTGLILSQPANPPELIRSLRSLADDGEAQLMRLNAIVDNEHLAVAAEHAVTAFEQGFAMSKSVAMESILYASGERQIERAIEKMGVRQGDTSAALLAISRNPDSLSRHIQSIEKSGAGDSDESLLEIWTREKRALIIEIFDFTTRQIRAARRVGESERDAIKKLVFEKMALISLEARRS